MATFEEFCGGPFWNSSLLVESDWPRFTPCFQNSLLAWVPVGIVAIFGPCWVWILYHRKRKNPLPISRLHAAKLMCHLTVIILTIVALLQKITHKAEGDEIPAAAFLADALHILAFAGMAVLGQFERLRGVIASDVQLLFWVLSSLCSIIPAYTAVKLGVYETDLMDFIVSYIVFGFKLCCFFLNCFAESPYGSSSKNGYASLERAECPVVNASAMSKLFFCWIFPLMRVGFQRDIEESDLWPLDPYLESDNHVPEFNRLWKEEVDRKKVEQPQGVEYTKSTNRIRSRPSKGERQPLLGVDHNSRISDFNEGPRSVYNQFLDRTSDPDTNSQTPEASLIRVLWRQFGTGFLVLTFQKLISDSCVFCGPVFLNLLINYMTDRQEGSEWQGCCIMVLMWSTGVFRVVIFNVAMASTYKIGMAVKSVLIAAIYRKAMNISNEAKKNSSAGDIVNLMSVDCQRIQEFTIKVSFCHTVPFMIAICVAFIYYLIGPAVLVGLLVLFCLLPVNIWVANRQRGLLKKNLRLKDSRLTMMNEVLSGIKALKLYAWEKCFHERVQETRAAEIAELLKIATLYVITGVCWTLAGFLVTLATFATYVLSNPHNYLDPGMAFITLAIFNILKTPMDFMSSMISLGTQAYVSAKRINKFLLQEELSQDNVIVMPESENVVTFEGADLSWDVSGPPTLKGINLHIPPGQLVAVVGPVGAGKSSLISAILGDMDKRSGTITRRGTIAYVPQQAWIQNATVQDNITFSKVFREKKYRTVVKACELERDFSILSAGDQTEIGEKGVNLSGGQKQRVSMARAVYHDCALYLLDDPLSAVDSHVGKAMFDNVIGSRGLLKNKTRILVTHGMHFLPQVDMIVVMNEGQITEAGTYEELLNHDGPFAQFLKEHLTQEQMEGSFIDDEDPEVASIKDSMWGRIEMLTSDAATSGDESRPLRRRRKGIQENSLTKSQIEKQTGKPVGLQKPGEKLISIEILEKGRVQPAVYLKYLRAAGILPIGIAMLAFWIFQTVSVFTNYWLTDWTQDPVLANSSTALEDFEATNHRYLAIYAVYGVVQGVLLVVYFYLFWTRMVQAGKNLHAQMTFRLFRAPMSFFDTTPIGRILNRCSRDIEIVDNLLPIICRDFLATFGSNLITLFVILVQTPIFGSVLVPVIILFFLLLRFYVPTSRQLRRIEHITRSPIYTHFSESLSGASTIRAYGATNRFLVESKRRVDYNVTYFYAASMALRWLSVNLDALSNIVIFATGVFQILTPGTTAGEAGLVLSYALQISGSLPWMVRQIADFETNIVSVERIKEYSEVVQESDWIVSAKRPKPTWPSKGVVQFNNFSMRYREGLELVIRGMTVRIEGGEKVGIVGRTGAGKSSLSLSLFRLVEAAEGSIMVDGVNIADIGLHDLRSRITVLPQDPVLFSGTLRMNLDPFDEFNEDDLWTSLERAHLKEFVNQLPHKLDYQCGEEGHNLSVGQRQLICLARTLLRKSKVLVLDEATAAVDIQTDALIQNTVRMAFQGCTVIAIAHRLNTILDYDKVMVMDAGLIKEFDSPTALLENSNSAFHSMAVDANLI